MALNLLPDDLPAPQDDGACKHLTGLDVPMMALPATNGRMVSLADLAEGRTVLYIYPMTGRPDRKLPDGWEALPGARGCTPQSCAFRDHYAELSELGVMVYGLSTQPTAYQLEAKQRLHLPFDLLSDAGLGLTHSLALPTLSVDELAEISPDIGQTLIKRLTLILSRGKIEHVFYPVFPPDQNATEVLHYLKTHPYAPA